MIRKYWSTDDREFIEVYTLSLESFHRHKSCKNKPLEVWEHPWSFVFWCPLCRCNLEYDELEPFSTPIVQVDRTSRINGMV